MSFRNKIMLPNNTCNSCLCGQVLLDQDKSKATHFEIIWSSSSGSDAYKSYFSSPKLIEFSTKIDGEKAYAYFYPPHNPNYQASQDERPPLVLESHGILSPSSIKHPPFVPTQYVFGLNI